MIYYVSFPNGVEGPFTVEQLQAAREAKRVTPGHYVREGVTGNWRLFRDVFDEQVEVVQEPATTAAPSVLQQVAVRAGRYDAGDVDHPLVMPRQQPPALPRSQEATKDYSLWWWGGGALIVTVVCLLAGGRMFDHWLRGLGMGLAVALLWTVMWLLRWLKPLAGRAALGEVGIVPKKTVIIITALALLCGVGLSWLITSRYTVQAAGNGRMVRSDRWTGIAWVNDKTNGVQWVQMMETLPKPVVRELTPEEDKLMDYGHAVNAYLWCIQNPNGGKWDEYFLTKEERDASLQKVRSAHPNVFR